MAEENVKVEVDEAIETIATEEPKKKKKGPEFKSNEYSILRYIIFLVVGFGGGQVVGALLAGVIVSIVPVFFDGGLLCNVKSSAMIIIGFFFNFIFAVLMIKPVLHTTFKSLVTGNRKYKIGFALVCLLIYIVVTVTAMLLTKEKIYYNPVDIGFRLACFIFAIILVPFQTTAEELFFRMSLGRLFMKNEVLKSVPKMLLASLVSGLIFFAPHLGNPEVAEYGMVAAIFSYFGVGFSLMLISCITGSFEGAIAVHAINNIWCMCIGATEVSAASFAPLFIDTNDDPVITCITLAALYGLLIIWSVIYRKKHKLAEA